MSREFGNEYGGFFHQKIANALDDAKGGRSRGAALMAALLEPLADLAYAVSSEEACDSSESRVVEAAFDAEPKLRQAMYALDAFIDPAKKLAIKVLADSIEPTSKIAETGFGYSVAVTCADLGEAGRLMHDAVCELVRRKHREHVYWCGSTWHSYETSTTHNVGKWGNAEQIRHLQRENEALKRQVAELETLQNLIREREQYDLETRGDA
jgi:hypothetical protein